MSSLFVYGISLSVCRCSLAL